MNYRTRKAYQSDIPTGQGHSVWHVLNSKAYSEALFKKAVDEHLD